jgi:hypothetical protein
MVYRFILVSDEADNFRRDITIDSDATFFELHEAILDSVGYTKDQITSFFICDDEWAKGAEITLIDMESNSDEDIYVMENSRLSELLDEERQKLIYVFESLTDRCFFIELREVIPGKNQEKPQTIKSVGEPPKQISAMEDLDFSAPVVNHGSDDDFIDDEFDLDNYDAYDDEALGDLNEDSYY